MILLNFITNLQLIFATIFITYFLLHSLTIERTHIPLRLNYFNVIVNNRCGSHLLAVCFTWIFGRAVFFLPKLALLIDCEFITNIRCGVLSCFLLNLFLAGSLVLAKLGWVLSLLYVWRFTGLLMWVIELRFSLLIIFDFGIWNFCPLTFRNW